MDRRPLSQVRADAVASLVRLVTAPDDASDGTFLRREVAARMIEARAHFITKDGRPDWSGRTYAYREFTREVFSDAGISREDAPTIQAAIRYHSGNLVRKVVPEEDLASAGFTLQESPRERSATRRAERSEATRLVESGGPLEGDDLARAVLLAASVLARASRGSVLGLPAVSRQDVEENLRSLSSRAAHLAGADG
ncbi:hypothetical protein H9623_18645 [Oerskovia sp. Sa1BUA8]|uniref:Uncharacterized protein n=1 Tax=Oerskovia douganii TaxID=2762210 RepID=A0A9D5UDE3_9CELL|nr:hypothetical protein [Oerskovia douganii]MBE7702314.1 hypothetical protein [Oerskovia douganii]